MNCTVPGTGKGWRSKCWNHVLCSTADNLIEQLPLSTVLCLVCSPRRGKAGDPTVLLMFHKRWDQGFTAWAKVHAIWKFGCGFRDSPRTVQ